MFCQTNKQPLSNFEPWRSAVRFVITVYLYITRLIMLTHIKFQDVGLINCGAANEELLILVTHLYKNKWRNLLKKSLLVCSKTVLGSRKRRKENANCKVFCVTRKHKNLEWQLEWKLQSFLRYTQAQKFRKAIAKSTTLHAKIVSKLIRLKC